MIFIKAFLDVGKRELLRSAYCKLATNLFHSSLPQIPQLMAATQILPLFQNPQPTLLLLSVPPFSDSGCFLCFLRWLYAFSCVDQITSVQFPSILLSTHFPDQNTKHIGTEQLR